jgi:hypothetical protein
MTTKEQLIGAWTLIVVAIVWYTVYREVAEAALSPRDRFRPPPLFDGCVTLRHQWEACARGRQCDHDDGV